MIVELHLLQSVPASTLNREDVEHPRHTGFGNVARGSISAHFLRRSTRGLLAESGADLSSAGISTRRLVSDAGRWIDSASCLDDPSDDTDDAVREAFYELGFGVAKADLTPSVMFTGQRASEELARFCLDDWDDYADRADRRKKIHANAESPEHARADELKLPNVKTKEEQLAAAERILAPRQALDVALHGGGIAEYDGFSAEPAVEVAHALSTHPAESGADAAPDGTVEVDAACYYRYARLDLARLAHNLGGDRELVERAAKLWLHSTVHAVPGSGPNATAARTVPEVVLAVVREHGSWNLANAFLDPVTGTDVLTRSADRLVEHFGRVRAFYGTDEIREVLGAAITGTLPLERTHQPSTLDDFTHRTINAALHG
ncbi:type I-E CRISPR-associated protein Cas7/Cse4/CasC [Saccharopolyspora sp. NPDC002578]